MVHLTLELNCAKTYKKAVKELNLINFDDSTKTITMELYDRWTAGQVIIGLDLSLKSYKIIQL